MKIYPIAFGLLVLTFFACVPPQQFAELNTEAKTCKEERELLRKENELLNVKSTELEASLEKSKKKIKDLVAEHAQEKEELEELRKENRQLKTQIQNLEETNQMLTKGSSAETKKLIGKLENSQLELFEREEKLNKLSKEIEDEQAKLKRMHAELDSRNKRLIELERLVNSKDSATNALREKVANALMGFENEGLTVSKRNGKVYVSLEEKLLFSSGSTTVDAHGVEALKKLAIVLEQNKDINITIEGHTDDVPVIPSDKFQDNWDLSVKRATSIIRILLDNSSINPKRLIASGRGEFLPIDNSKTDEARQLNRRTEIILTPNLDEIMELLGK